MKFTLVTSASLILMLFGVLLSIFGRPGLNEIKVFFTLLGTLGWFVGNTLVSIEERIQDLENKK